MGHQLSREALQQELAEVRKPLEDWRRRKSGRDSIPAAIWDKAVEVASRHGVGPVAAGLRLDHAKLKSKLAAAAKAKVTATLPVPVQRAAPVQTAFVELFGTPPSPSEAPTQPSGPVVRFKSPRGLQVRLDWGDSDISGLAKLLKEVL